MSDKFRFIKQHLKHQDKVESIKGYNYIRWCVNLQISAQIGMLVLKGMKRPISKHKYFNYGFGALILSLFPTSQILNDKMNIAYDDLNNYLKEIE